jgi:hypothetical protein
LERSVDERRSTFRQARERSAIRESERALGTQWAFEITTRLCVDRVLTPYSKTRFKRVGLLRSKMVYPTASATKSKTCSTSGR